MKKQRSLAIILILSLFVAGCTDVAKHVPVRPTPIGKRQTHPKELLWSDEFNGPYGALPASNRWSANIGGQGWGNKQLEYDTNNQNVYQDGKGDLVLEARKGNPSKLQCWYGSCRYTSARITTNGHFSFTYGRLEARIKLPYGQGIWPAFWILGNNISSVGWPACGEIDIMENFGDNPLTISGSVHGIANPAFSSIYHLSGGSFASEFHIFAVEWSRNKISFFVDNTNYAVLYKTHLQKWIFDHPFDIIFNIAVGGKMLKAPDANTVFPQKMYVDYVRLYSI